MPSSLRSMPLRSELAQWQWHTPARATCWTCQQLAASRPCPRPRPRPRSGLSPWLSPLPSSLRAAAFSTSAMRREPLPWTERLRRKIWGTDGPPGQPDPDVRLEPEEVERLEQAQEARQKRRRKQAVAALPGPRPVPGADGYQPATTWHGLGRVGTLPIDEARRKQPFQSFLLEVPLTEPRLLTAALQTAVMDVLHLRRGGLVRTESVQHAALEAAPSQDAQSASDPKARVPRVELDPALAAISLEDLNTKFAVMREVMRLTGRRIPDPVIARIEHVGGLHEYLLTPAKPKTVADALVAHEALTALPNVTIHTRRVTPIDREKVVGRWKVIERELEARGLPVTGRG